MTDTGIKDKILTYIQEKPGTSYAEIERIFSAEGFDYTGDLAQTAGEQYPNIILWAGWNKQAVDIISELVGSGSVQRVPCDLLIYLIDGKTLGFPLQKDSNNHKRPHWMPCVFTAKAALPLP